MAGAITLEIASATDVGLVREHNEDALASTDLTTGRRMDPHESGHIELGPRGALLMVCDGMGGAAAGEVAATMAVDTVSQRMSSSAVLDQDGPVTIADFARILRMAAWSANSLILETARLDPNTAGMGTTMTAVGVLGPQLVVAQVGDSRAYILRQGKLGQLSRDQSLLNELLDTGQITEEEAVTFEHSNVILQALGVQDDVEVQLSKFELRRGDWLLLCSDGLSAVTGDEEIAARVMQSKDCSEACHRLIELARDAGGPDNITVVVVRFSGDGLVEPQSSDPAVGHVCWHLDESDGYVGAGEASLPLGADAEDTARAIPLVDAVASDEMPARRYNPAHVFLLLAVLLTLAIGGLIWASAIHR